MAESQTQLTYYGNEYLCALHLSGKIRETRKEFHECLRNDDELFSFVTSLLHIQIYLMISAQCYRPFVAEIIIQVHIRVKKCET